NARRSCAMSTEPSTDPPREGRGLFSALFAETAPIDLRIIGRTLLHAALVGLLAGFVSVVFFGALEHVEVILLGHLAGYTRLRAHGETMLGHEHTPTTFRPWLVLVIPAFGALAGGLLTSRFAPEAQGGGGDAMIDAFHHHKGRIRRRVAW